MCSTAPLEAHARCRTRGRPPPRSPPPRTDPSRTSLGGRVKGRAQSSTWRTTPAPRWPLWPRATRNSGCVLSVTRDSRAAAIPRGASSRASRAPARAFRDLPPSSGNALARAFPVGTPARRSPLVSFVTVRPPVSRVLPHATSTTEVLRRAGERDGRARELLSARARRRAARAPPPGAPGDGRARGRTRAEPPFLQVRRRRAGGVVVRGGPHGRHPPALDGDPQGLRAPARPRGGPRAAGVLLQLRQRGCAPCRKRGAARRRRWTTTR